MNNAIRNYLDNEVLPSIKATAREKIVAFLPDWKQSNYNARMNDLNNARFDRELTAGEQAEIAALRALWARAQAIREASNVHEAAVSALETIEEVVAYDYATGWPGE